MIKKEVIVFEKRRDNASYVVKHIRSDDPSMFKMWH
jgi:hypothetical protein